MNLNAASTHLEWADAAFLCVLSTVYEVHIVCATKATYIRRAYSTVDTQTRRVRALIRLEDNTIAHDCRNYQRNVSRRTSCRLGARSRSWSDMLGINGLNRAWSGLNRRHAHSRLRQGAHGRSDQAIAEFRLCRYTQYTFCCR